MIFSSGMFNACSAYLPQQFVLCCVLLSFAALFQLKHSQAIFWIGMAGIIGWPFIALIAIPMAIDCYLKMQFIHFVKIGVTFATILGTVSIAIDFYFYRRFVFAAWNIFSYNIYIHNTESDNDVGQNLYGM